MSTAASLASKNIVLPLVLSPSVPPWTSLKSTCRNNGFRTDGQGAKATKHWAQRTDETRKLRLDNIQEADSIVHVTSRQHVGGLVIKLRWQLSTLKQTHQEWPKKADANYSLVNQLTFVLKTRGKFSFCPSLITEMTCRLVKGFTPTTIA